MNWNHSVDDCSGSKWSQQLRMESKRESNEGLILSENCQRNIDIISSIMESQAVDLSFLKEILRILNEEDRREKDSLLHSLLQLIQEQNQVLQIMKVSKTDLNEIKSISSALHILHEKSQLLKQTLLIPSKPTHNFLFRAIRIAIVLIPFIAFLLLMITSPDAEVLYSFSVSKQTY